MKKFGKSILIMLGIIIGVPVMIVVLGAIFGFGALFVVAPEIMIGIVIFLLLISIPGILVGLIAGHHKK